MTRTLMAIGITAMLALGGAAALSQPDLRKALTTGVTSTSVQMMTLAQRREWVTMATVGREYRASHPGVLSAGDPCVVTLYSAWAEIMLDHRDVSNAALTAYQRGGCADKMQGTFFKPDLERQIRRVLNGEAATVEY